YTRSSSLSLFLSTLPPPPTSTLFPYTTLFRSLRYDLRKLKGHGLLERDGSRYAYRLTPQGIQVALLFLFFHKRLCGPLAHSRFRSEEHTSELQSRFDLVCRLLLEKKKKKKIMTIYFEKNKKKKKLKKLES